MLSDFEWPVEMLIGVGKELFKPIWQFMYSIKHLGSYAISFTRTPPRPWMKNRYWIKAVKKMISQYIPASVNMENFLRIRILSGAEAVL